MAGRLSILTIFVAIFALGLVPISFAQESPEIPPEDPPIIDLPPPDTDAPIISIPDSFSVSADSILGAIVTYSASALDVVDGAVDVTCLPSSGSQFALGKTQVTCTASDSSGNIVTASFIVTVVDNVGPILIAPADITMQTTKDSVIVTYSISNAQDDIDGLIIPSCTPESGSSFTIGFNEVTCTATDTSGNTSTVSFKVNVQNLQEIVLTELETLEQITVEEIGDVNEHIDDFVNTANILFDFQHQSVDDLKTEFQANVKNADAKTIKELRKDFNKDLTELKKQSKDLLKQYDFAFKEFRHNTKDLAKQLKSLSIQDKKFIQKMDQSYLKIINTNYDIDDGISILSTTSKTREMKYAQEELEKTKSKLYFAEMKVDKKATPEQIELWKETKKGLKNTIHDLKDEIKQIQKDAKKEFKSLVKEAKKDAKALEKEAKTFEKILEKQQKQADKQAKKDQKKQEKQAKKEQKEQEKQQKKADKAKKKADKKKDKNKK